MTVTPPEPAEASAIAVVAQDIARALDDARIRADSGEAVDLCGLDRRMAGLCAAAAGLDGPEMNALRPHLMTLMASLEAVEAALRRQHQRPDGNRRPAAPPLRAALVYGGSK